MMGLFIVSKLLLITFALQSTEEKWKIHATAEPDNSVRFGEFCLRISDDSTRTSSKSVTQQPTKSARPTRQTTQQPTTEPTDLKSLSTQKNTEPAYSFKLTKETGQPYREKPLIAPRNLQSGCYCDKREKKHLNETSSLRILMTEFPSETCNSTQFIGELKDGSKVCMTRLSFLDYFNAISGPQSEPANEASSYEEPLVTSPTPLDPTTELAMTTHPSVTESKQHDPTPQMTQTPQHTTHVGPESGPEFIKVSHVEADFSSNKLVTMKEPIICLYCNPFPNWHNIKPNDVQFMKMDVGSLPCPIYIHVTLKNNENFCVDSSQPWFRTLLEKLKI